MMDFIAAFHHERLKTYGRQSFAADISKLEGEQNMEWSEKRKAVVGRLPG